MKILIAEDDFISRTVLQEILSPFGTCHLAVDGLEAVTAYRRALEANAPYDLICLDIMMPRLDGQQVLKQIRELEAAKGIGGAEMAKVVMITALDDPKNIMSALVRGSCEDYLIKPIQRDDLLARLRRSGLIRE